MWWPFKKTIEERLIGAFQKGLRDIQVSLYKRLRSQSITGSDSGPLRLGVLRAEGALAAQVVNYLKGEDIAAVIENTPEPLKSQIVRIKHLIPDSAARAMAESGSTREVVVATLRMREVLEFMLQGESYLRSDQHQRVCGLLSRYGPEFPEEIKPDKYLEMAHRYRQENLGPG